MKSREIDFDNDNHILFDKWIYISIDNQVAFEDVCKLIEKTHLLRMDLQKIIHSNIQDLQSLPRLTIRAYLPSDFSSAGMVFFHSSGNHGACFYQLGKSG